MTIEYNGIELELEIEYQPYEASTLEYPGSQEDVFIEEVIHKGESIYTLIGEEQWADIYEIVWEEIKKYR